jgi:hypothetical protein
MSGIRPADQPHPNNPRSQWTRLLHELVLWAGSLIVRKDAYGTYIPPGQRSDPKRVAFTMKAEPTEAVLKAHFSGQGVIGLFVLAEDGSCRVVVIDIDRHDEVGDAEVNEKAAITLFDRAIVQGCSAFLEDSNGRGGYKLWLIFKEPVPARWARRFARRLIQDWKELGLMKEPEIFPKRDRLEPGQFGNFVRLPGLHHTLPHWSRIRADGRWTEGEEAAREIIAVQGSSADIIPAEFRSEPAEPAPASVPKKARVAFPSAGLIRRLTSALESFPSGYPGTYEQWLELGMSLFDLGDEGLKLWEAISQKCPKYRYGACREKWPTFKPGGGLTYRTILYLAKKHGWKPSKNHASPKSANSVELDCSRPTEPPVVEPSGPAAPQGSDQVASSGGKPPGDNQTTPPSLPGGDGPPPNPRPQSGSLPVIVWNDRQMHPVTAEAMNALKLFNSNPRHFQLGNMLVRIRSGQGGHVIEEHTENSLRGLLDRSARWAMSFETKGDKKLVVTPPPKHIVRDILSLPEWPSDAFPPLEAIVHCPTYAKDGSLIDQPGYHLGSRNFYSPPSDLIMPPVPVHISKEVLEKAKGLLKELLVNFPFKSDGDYANALSVPLTTLARNMITGPTPFMLIEAPVMGTGKSKLAEVLLIPSLGRPSTTAQPENDDEWRKSITASLLNSPQAIWYDNLAGSLKSQKLEQVLTSDMWTDRYLGETRTVSLPVRCTWLGTANNLQILGDLHRRIVWIWLVCLMERPEDRDPSQFKHPLPEWARDSRGDLLWAALVLIRAWVEQGRPPGPQSMASYESWAKTIGGILQVAGIPGFLEDQKERRIDSDDSASQWEAFLKFIYENLGSQDFGVNELKWVVDPDHESFNGELLQGVLTKESKGDRAKQMGWRLKQNENRVYGRYQLVMAGRDGRSNCRRYNVKKLDEVLKASAKYVPAWDNPNELIPLQLNAEQAELSREYWSRLETSGLLRDDLGGYDEYLFEACHNLLFACDHCCLVTDRALIRFMEAYGRFPTLFPLENWPSRQHEFHNHYEMFNLILSGLMKLTAYDTVYHEGRKFIRYGIFQGTDLIDPDQTLASCPDNEPSTALQAETSKYIGAEYYPMFVEICRRWWLFENHTLGTLRLLDLVQKFNLIPDFVSYYPEEPQEQELARMIKDVEGLEFDGFVISSEEWTIYTRRPEGEPYYEFTLRRLPGFNLPPILSHPHDPLERQAWVMEFQWTERTSAWLLGQWPII